MSLAIALPTRGRPERVIETVGRSIANWTRKDTVLWIMADEDDPMTIEAFNKAQSVAKRDNVRLSVKKREDTIAEKWNRILKLEPKASVYLAGADDDPYLTPGYDERIIEAAKLFPDGIGMVYGHMANASFSRCVAPTAGLVRKMGYMFPEYFPYWFVDHWTDDVAKLIGRISFADITTDQTRPGKTQELREVDWWATWFDAAYLMRREIAHKIVKGKDFQEPEWRRELILRNHPLVEFHSRWTNNYVRGMAPTLNQWSGLSTINERYQRVKKRAEAMVPDLLKDMPPEEYAQFQPMLMPAKDIPSIQRKYA